MELKMTDNISDEAWGLAIAGLTEGAEILQSSVWRRISEDAGLHVYRYAWQTQGEIVVLAQVIESKKAGFKFWYVPRGPICLTADKGKEVWDKLIADLKLKAREHGAIALRFEPTGWAEIKFWDEQIHIQPPHTLFLDLRKSEDELLSEMHQKTRYNIRLAEKRGVVIERGGEAEIEAFYNLMQKTTARDRFRGHSLAHYRSLLTQSEGAIELWLAQKDGEILAAGIFSCFEGRAIYLHGASDDKGREHMAPYLLQWRMIQKAKTANCFIYDFYGIDEKKWPGVTRFKRGFGGYEKKYPGTFIIVLNELSFSIYSLLARLRRLF
ncbi:MAG: peptidoglycan bridge formation glycyltransferase FemA/FemB family protein [bacterium]|nr:peptidoglycan bridge formation glycyltransferase FemA/FemB family protein [bacterium]